MPLRFIGREGDLTTYYDFRLKSITIQSFRGFQDPATLDLNASAVVLSGPNGTGKTSVFDAVQWVLLGSIERLQGFWVRRNVEHIVNSYSHRTSGRAEVVLEVAVDGRAVRLCRRGDHKDSTLEIIGAGSSPLFADAAEAWLGKVLASHQPDALAALLTACGLMQQDVMRSVLEAKPADRHEWLGAVLGLGDLEGFEREVKQAAADADNHRKSVEQQVGGAEESVQEATERLEELEYRAEHSASVESAWAEVLAMAGAAPGGMRIEVPDAINSQQAVGMERDARYLSRRMAELFAAFQALKDTEDGLDSEPASEDVEEAARTADETTAAFEKADAEQRRCEELLTVAEEAAKQTARLAAAAVPLLDRTCPVCEQPIDPAQVEKRLREMSSGTSTLVERRQAVEEAAKRARQAEQSKDASQRELASLKACRKQWESARKQEKNPHRRTGKPRRGSRRPVRFATRKASLPVQSSGAAGRVAQNGWNRDRRILRTMGSSDRAVQRSCSGINRGRRSPTRPFTTGQSTSLTSRQAGRPRPRSKSGL